MNVGTLEFFPITKHPDLLSSPTRKYLSGLPQTDQISVGVAEINPAYAGGEELCSHYNIDPSFGGNCIVIEATRADRKWYAACLVSPGSRMDINGLVRKRLNARRVSLAPKQTAIDLSGMEYGSINVVGLPNDWLILIDSSLLEKPFVIMGSGLVKSKIKLPSNLLATLPNAQSVDGLGMS